MQHGFLLFIDEAGDEGIESIKPIDADGSPEYFVLSGVLVRTSTYNVLKDYFVSAKKKINLLPHQEIHFKNLNDDDKVVILNEIAGMRVLLFCVVSNKLNMRGYRNKRCERSDFEVVKGKIRPKRNSWFYNNMLRYMLERVTQECARWTYLAYGEKLPLKVVMSARKGFSYSQTNAYLRKISVRKHDKSYFNNRNWIDWSMIDISGLEDRRSKAEPGLQVADCVASSVFRALDASWFGNSQPTLIQSISGKFAKNNGSCKDHGFKLLPDGFKGPVSEDQSEAFKLVGYNIKCTSRGNQ